MTCQATLAGLPAYLTEQLSHAERDAVEAHVAGCDGCRAELASLAVLEKRLGYALRLGAEGMNPPADAWARLQTRVQPVRPTATPRAPTLGVAASSALHRLMAGQGRLVPVVLATLLVILMTALLGPLVADRASSVEAVQPDGAGVGPTEERGLPAPIQPKTPTTPSAPTEAGGAEIGPPRFAGSGPAAPRPASDRGAIGLPSRTATPHASPTATLHKPTPSATPLHPTRTATAHATATHVPPHATATPQPPHPSATSTVPHPTATHTPPHPTATHVPPHATATPVPPHDTATPLPPHPTATHAPPHPTATPAPPHPTATAPHATATPVPTHPTATPHPSSTPVPPHPTATPTVPHPTATHVPPHPTNTPHATATHAPPTETPHPTQTPAPHPTETPHATATPGPPHPTATHAAPHATATSTAPHGSAMPMP